jgi:phosphate starvation-inducible protein PhoH
MSRKNRKMQSPQQPKRYKDRRMQELNSALYNNGKAIDDGVPKKVWTKHDLQSIKALTPPQEDMVHGYLNGYDICGYGSAGTGKTLVALYLAFLDILDEKSPRKKIIIIRSTVPTRDLGHLPGTIEEKIAPHEATYPPLFRKLFGKSSTYVDMKDAGIVEFKSTSFVRGLTFDDAVMIFDEATNTTLEEFDSVITRRGKSTTVFVLGDLRQNDLVNTKEKSGFAQALMVMETTGDYEMVKFTVHDVIRSKAVKNWILARESLGI